MSIRAALLGAAMLLGSTLVAGAQAQYPAYPYPYYQAPPSPAWNYDPYTSGLANCPQRHPGEPPCSQMIQPSYGQPNYWPHP